MFVLEQGGAGFIENKDGNISFDKTDPEWPFRVRAKRSVTTVKRKKHKGKSRKAHKTKDEEKLLKYLFEEDESGGTDEETKEVIRKIKRRNNRAVRLLKELYGGICQISDEEFSFKKKDGTYYSEAHHLIPLGEGGADSPHNLIIVNPLIHKMLHYADVSPIDLKDIEENKLTIEINGEKYVIGWHPKHAEIVEEALED
jgi:5-methylcytosine-specific restriction protein A